MKTKKENGTKISPKNKPLDGSLATQIDHIAATLAKKIDKEVFDKKYAPHREVLTLVGAGVFLTASLILPGLPLALRPFLRDKYQEENSLWKRFNIPYLHRTIKRLESQKLVEIGFDNGRQVVMITDAGRKKVLKYALDELKIEKPGRWNGKWTLVTYDIPEEFSSQRDYFRGYLRAWRFYPIEKSVFLHAYPCRKEIEFLREYLGVSQYVNIFIVDNIEKNVIFREYFGV